MKIYVAIGHWDHEGNDDPIGVYSTPELARQALEAHKESRYADPMVIEYELDELKAWGEQSTKRIIR